MASIERPWVIRNRIAKGLASAYLGLKPEASELEKEQALALAQQWGAEFTHETEATAAYARQKPLDENGRIPGGVSGLSVLSLCGLFRNLKTVPLCHF